MLSIIIILLYYRSQLCMMCVWTKEFCNKHELFDCIYYYIFISQLFWALKLVVKNLSFFFFRSLFKFFVSFSSFSFFVYSILMVITSFVPAFLFHFQQHSFYFSWNILFVSIVRLKTKQNRIHTKRSKRTQTHMLYKCLVVLELFFIFEYIGHCTIVHCSLFTHIWICVW